MKEIISFLKELSNEFVNDNAPILAAAQAYYYLLSIVPLLILVLAILPYLDINPDNAIQLIQSALPSEMAEILQDTIFTIISTPSGGLLTIGIIGTIWSASNGMNAFILATNTAYNVTEKRSFLNRRLHSVLLTFGMIIALVATLILPVFGEVIMSFVRSFMVIPGDFEIIFFMVRTLLGFVIMALVLAALYYFAPTIKLPFKMVLPGAIFAIISWQVISWGFSYYVSNFGNFSATYGSLGGIIILMLWFFLTGLILVVGAEINAIYYNRKSIITVSRVK
ncbi:YihY/virulence factor BrkB family protein [Salipaludibacillus sp. CF4.18]|uniref:YihY/virulence factor BrkB family protein n=1 Tax=Salipaludibacillus sp. CF4.18 TaxID=3373081 RepID=UPI003EE435DE